MEPDAYLEHLSRDGDALAAAARRAPDSAIGSCPGWDMTRLLGHVGRVYRWADQLVATRSDTYVKGPKPPEGFDATLEWYQQGRAQLRATLEGTDPSVAVWNWSVGGPAPAIFWWRRLAHETAVHRWDAEAAAGQAQPIATDLAVDGIDEYIGFVTGWLAREPIPGLEGSLHLHATDTEGEWSLFLRPDGVEHIRQHVKADAAIRGPVSDLELWMTNRVPVDSTSLTVFGNTELLERWRQVQF